MFTRLTIVLTVLLAATLTHAQPQNPDAADQQAKLPVTRAVLFSSGVGYFEHTGTVTGDTELTLNFKTDQINDILKSMILMDHGGGNVTSVTYPSRDPVERALRSFEVDISGDPTLAELLKQLRGEKVTVITSRQMTGLILSVEPITKVIGDPQTRITTWRLNLVTDEGVRSVKLDDLSGLKFEDAALQAELNKALALLVSARDKDRKPIDIQFTGEGERKVQVGYLVETPVWKTSYRLDLSDDKPLLQGWAIVENTSDIDWQNVKLSLVSGRPMSFVMDLYTPLYVPRPVVELERYASLVPKAYDESIMPEDEEAAEMDRLASRTQAKAPRRLAEMRRGLAGEALADRAAPADAMDDARLRESGVRSVAAAGDVGELFSFNLKHRVDLARRRSAMLPIVNEDVKAQKVSIYNANELAKHPFNGVRLTNSTGMKLMAGPVTVFDSGAYAGDARIDHLADGEQRLLSYAVDLDVSVDPSQKSSSTLTGVKIVRGVLNITRKYVYEQTYAIRNKAKADRTIVVEHSFHSQRKLIEPEKPTEKTADLYRFDVPVLADKTVAFDVREEQVTHEHIAILNASPRSLVWYTRQGGIDDKVKDALSKAIQMKNELEQLESKLNNGQRQTQQIEQGQDRLRKNLGSVGRDSQLGKRYIKKLDDEETRIEGLEKEIAALRKLIESKREALNDYLSSLNIG